MMAAELREWAFVGSREKCRRNQSRLTLAASWVVK